MLNTFWIILFIFEFTFIICNFNEWLSTHSYYHRLVIEAHNKKLKIRHNHTCTHLNIVYGVRIGLGAFLIIWESMMISALYQVTPLWALWIFVLLCAFATTFITNAASTLIDDIYNHRLNIRYLLKHRR